MTCASSLALSALRVCASSAGGMAALTIAPSSRVSGASYLSASLRRGPRTLTPLTALPTAIACTISRW